MCGKGVFIYKKEVCVCVYAHVLRLIQHNLIWTDNSSTLHASASAVSDSSIAHEGGRKKRKWSSFISPALSP